MAHTDAVPYESHPPSMRSAASGPESIAPEIIVRSHGRSVKGTRRDTNRDQFLVAEVGRSLRVRQTSLLREDHARILGRCQGHLLVVADGSSSKLAREFTSSVAVDALADYVVGVMPWFARLDARGEDDLEDELAAAIERCQPRVWAASAAAGEYTARGTTLTMAYVAWPRAWIVHLGDSRGYLLRQGRLERITQDHSVAPLQGRNMLDLKEAGTSPWRRVIWNAIGAAEGTDDPEVYGSRVASVVHLADYHDFSGEPSPL
jgi:serine/threonine protein phosphatase PrpC